MAGDAGKEAVNVAGALTSMSIDQMVSKLAIGIAEGQMELDKASMEIAEFMGDAQIAFGKKAGTDIPDLISLIELGFTPNFYQFVDTILEMRVSVKTSFAQKREYNTKETDAHQDSASENTNYENNRSRVDSGKRSSSSYSSNRKTTGVRYGWWGGSVTRGSSSYNASASDTGVRTSNTTKFGRNTSKDNKNISVSTVDAKFSAKYQYSVEASSTIKTKIVPIPAPEVLEEIIRANIGKRKEAEQRFIWAQQVKSLIPSIRQIAQDIHDTDDDGDVGNIKELSSDLPTVDLPKVKTIRKNAKALLAKYSQLTNDHWAIIDNIPDRETADDALEAIPENIEKLIVDIEMRIEKDLPTKKEADGTPITPDYTNLVQDEIDASINTLKKSALDLAWAMNHIEGKLIEKEEEEPEQSDDPLVD